MLSNFQTPQMILPQEGEATEISVQPLERYTGRTLPHGKWQVDQWVWLCYRVLCWCSAVWHNPWHVGVWHLEYGYGVIIIYVCFLVVPLFPSSIKLSSLYRLWALAHCNQQLETKKTNQCPCHLIWTLMPTVCDEQSLASLWTSLVEHKTISSSSEKLIRCHTWVHIYTWRNIPSPLYCS
jgi:hypothetical protein